MNLFTSRQTVSFFGAWLKALYLASSLLLGAASAQAMPLLNVGGVSNAGYIILPDQAAAVSFSFTQAFSGVSITADLTKINPATDGGVFLVSNLGPSANLGHIVATQNFSAISFIGSGTVLFSGLNLGIGDYFMVVANSQSTLGNVIWNGSNAASVTQASGVLDGIDFFASNTSGFLFNSAFTPILASDRSAFFAVTAVDPVVTHVPEPGSLLLMVFGLAGLAGARARKRMH